MSSWGRAFLLDRKDLTDPFGINSRGIFTDAMDRQILMMRDTGTWWSGNTNRPRRFLGS